MSEHVLDRYRVDHRQPGEVLAQIDKAGIALIDGITDRGKMTRAAAGFMVPRTHRDAEPDDITDIRPDPERQQRIAGAGFSRNGIAPHTEGTSLVNPPRLLLLVCAEPAEHGGDTILVDGAAVHRHLIETAPAAAASLCRPGAVGFGINHYRAAVFDASPLGVMGIRYRDDHLVSLAETDQPAWEQLRGIVARHQVSLLLQRGEGILVDNFRWLHGRKDFTGARHMFRLIGDLPQRQAISSPPARSQFEPRR